MKIIDFNSQLRTINSELFLKIVRFLTEEISIYTESFHFLDESSSVQT